MTNFVTRWKSTAEPLKRASKQSLDYVTPPSIPGPVSGLYSDRSRPQLQLCSAIITMYGIFAYPNAPCILCVHSPSFLSLFLPYVQHKETVTGLRRSQCSPSRQRLYP